jgi:PhzF family phenazine biosynthesis protein
MRTPIFQVDAFTTRRFAGNPAAVMPMARFPADALMQAIAAENNLAETAFLVPEAATTAYAGSRRTSKCRFAATPPWPAQQS